MRTQAALSKIKILPDDVFLVSYPRSGNTWTSLLLSNYVSEVNYDKQGLSNSVVAELYQASPEALAQKASPRIIKIHSSFEATLPRVIYLVRDARDVAVSYYFFYRKFKGEDISFEDYLPKFNSGELDSFGVWNYHTNSWLNQREGSPDFLLVRYEDLKEDTHKQLVRMVDFVWGEVNHQRVDVAVKATGISRLQDSEKRSQWFAGTNENISFFRKGVVGDWENYFNQETLKDFISFHGRGLKRLGYLEGEGNSSEDLSAEGNISPSLQPNSLAFDIQMYQMQESLYQSQEQLNILRNLRRGRPQDSKANLSLNPPVVGAENSLQASAQSQTKSKKRLERKISKIEQQLQHLRETLKRKNSQIRESNQKLRVLEEEVSAMKGSKFWRLQELWLRIRKN